MTAREAIMIVEDWIETLDFCGGCDFVNLSEEYYKKLREALETLVGFAEWY